MTASDWFDEPQTAALANAAAEGNMDKVNEIIKQGGNVNAIGKDGVTPLLWAFLAENKKGMEALLKAKANPNQIISSISQSLMSSAVKRGDPDYLKLLLKYGGEPNSEDRNGSPIIRGAINYGKIKHIDLLLNYGVSFDRRINGVKSPIEWAAIQERWDVVEYFILKGADHTVLNEYGGSWVSSITLALISEERSRVINFLEDKGVKFPFPMMPVIGMLKSNPKYNERLPVYLHRKAIYDKIIYYYIGTKKHSIDLPIYPDSRPVMDGSIDENDAKRGVRRNEIEEFYKNAEQFLIDIEGK